MSVPDSFRAGTEAHVLLWMAARRRSDGVVEGFGIWTGQGARGFTVDGQTRSYLGSGMVLSVGAIRAAVGGEVGVHQIQLPPLRPEVRAIFSEYDLHQAEIEMHGIALQDHVVIWSDRWIRGTLDRTPTGLSREGGAVSLEVVSRARRGTFGLPLYRSDEQHRRSWPADRFREWVGVAGERRVPWGQ